MFPKASIGVEVGVWRGDFSRVILRAVDPSRLHLVDPWQFDPERPEAWYGGAQVTSQREMDAIYQKVMDRFRPEERVSVHRKSSTEVARSLADDELDWVYLDGDHSYEGVRTDLQNWLPKLRCGGLLCGDDYGVAGWWGDGVTRAVNEALRSTALRPLLLYGGQYALQKLESSRRSDAS